jgi:ABC-type multidrug transport system fused ATPase/permease subunit
VIFDEATSSLDSAAEKKVQDSFWQMAKNPQRPVTSIIIAHRLSTIMRADRIIVLDQGRLVDMGTHEELLAKPGSIYAKLWRLQQNGFLGDGESQPPEM